MVEIVITSEQEALKYANGGIKIKDKSTYGFPSLGPNSNYALKRTKYSLSDDSETENYTKVDPSPSGRRPDLTAKGKKELVTLFTRKSDMENRGKNNTFRTTLRIYTTNSSGHLRRKLPVRYANKDRRRPDLTARRKKELVALSPGKSGMENRGKFKQRCTLAYTIPSQRMFSRSTVSTPHRT
ncbi:hypothetical protein PHYBLDRAFT_141249 [Phycomyces blakesleeanus NRRL 1555(-)]|uniref:Uncharacterized protein n=1 Tax=Phycomyces blakesleeanus (strain ATCC 8743b / DSM 1359 / FGSC 10004 / NBRC 33097 / NRRL 1555) TaxID=763407 RepID=A0A162XYY8_PHYB8|nr:hypothetical protein PHYBLDRAFT_141249 [Phycomyces blakesleeanus NRRL 1555(-)]OAD77365.1 hypothetical protein PHYBLDRAFT_141249 [Phycomyces blakesleeanus NRRL 1555(-)]|eukprot:XP_018295405.1 hypothetical protein PHYBLDRAFT_141249 [Phycomyces blakesleeanus NRRL 1555(-)]